MLGSSPGFIKCLIFVMFVFFLGGHSCCHFRHFLGRSPARGFKTSLFPNLYTGYLDFVSIVVSSRWLEKDSSCKTVFGEN